MTQDRQHTQAKEEQPHFPEELTQWKKGPWPQFRVYQWQHPHRERFVIRLKIPQTVLPFPSHKFISPRTPARVSGDKKGQSYFLIWSSLLYSPSALGGRSGFIPRESHEQFSKHLKPPEKAAAGIHTWNKGLLLTQTQTEIHGSSSSPAPPPERRSLSHKYSRLVLIWDTIQTQIAHPVCAGGTGTLSIKNLAVRFNNHSLSLH